MSANLALAAGSVAGAALFLQYAALLRYSRTLSLLFSCRLSMPIDADHVGIRSVLCVTEAAQLGAVTQTSRPNSSASQEQGMRGVEI